MAKKMATLAALLAAGAVQTVHAASKPHIVTVIVDECATPPTTVLLEASGSVPLLRLCSRHCDSAPRAAWASGTRRCTTR